jgi:hypothetical protein
MKWTANLLNTDGLQTAREANRIDWRLVGLENYGPRAESCPRY